MKEIKSITKKIEEKIRISKKKDILVIVIFYLPFTRIYCLIRQAISGYYKCT